MSTEDSISTVSSPEDTEDELEKLSPKEEALETVTEEDSIDQLINKIKSLTTLMDLAHEDWSLRTDEAMQEFLTSRKESVLVLFYDEDKLVAVCGFPSFELPDLMYFVKCSDADVTLDNFHRLIAFGSVKNLPEAALLTLLEQIYAPVYFNIKDWPDSVKQELVTALWQTTSSLSRVRYKVAGLSVIAIPPTALRLTPSHAAKNEHFVKMLESIISEWTSDILEALRDLDETSPEFLLVPLDVLQFWKYRYENLRGFSFQVSNKHCQHVIAILSIIQSSCVTSFHSVLKDVQEAVTTADSNLQYLQIIEEPCLALEQIQAPMDALPLIPQLLHSFKIIRDHSPHYNSPEKMSQLCRALSNQVIISCRNLIDLSILFEGRTRSSMKIFQECIQCCSTYKSMYNKVKLTNDATADSQWNSDLKIILNSVDTFMERCQEMIELCETMLIYGRLDETQDVPKPTFGFTRGAEFEKVCDKIEDLFHESFSKVEQVQDCILDVQSSDWYREMNRFRKDMKKIDTIAENLILESFNMVKNVEEGLLTLQSLYEYSKRPSLFNVIEKKTAMVYKMFWDELQEAKLSLLSEKNSYARLMPKYAGRAWTSLVKKTQLKSLYDLFQEKLWLPKVTIAVEIESLYQDIIQTFDEAILSNYKRWLEVAESKIGVRLKRSLICRSLQKPGLLEVNIDRKLLYVFSEAKLWVDMGFPIPNEMNQLVARRNELTLLYRNVETCVQNYNRVMASLSDSERVLFRDLIRSQDRQLSVCWRMSWASEAASARVLVSTEQLQELQSFIDDYKTHNVRIVRLCERICATAMVDVETKLYELDHLVAQVQACRFTAMAQLIRNYNKIFKRLRSVFEGFKSPTRATMFHFMQYVEKIDTVLLEAFRLCVKNSMQKILSYLRGDLIKGPKPFVVLYLTLSKENEVEFIPSLTACCSFLRNIFYDLLISIKVIPRLATKFNPAAKVEPYAARIARDNESTRLQVQVEKEIQKLVSEVDIHVQKWAPLEDIWSVDKDIFMKNYEKSNPCADTYETDINRHNSLMETIDSAPDRGQVYFLLIDSVLLKRGLTEHCADWKSRLLELLFQTTSAAITRTHDYATRNTARITTKPRSATEILDSIKTHKQLMSELEVMKLRFVTIESNVRVYLKVAKSIPGALLEQKGAMEEAWRDYERILGEINAVLNDSAQQTSKLLFERGRAREKDTRPYLENVLSDPTFTDQWNVEDASKYLNEVLSQLQRIYRDLEKA